MQLLSQHFSKNSILILFSGAMSNFEKPHSFICLSTLLHGWATSNKLISTSLTLLSNLASNHELVFTLARELNIELNTMMMQN